MENKTQVKVYAASKKRCHFLKNGLNGIVVFYWEGEKLQTNRVENYFRDTQ